MRLDKHDFYLSLRSAGINQLNLDEARTAYPDNAQWIDVRTQDEYEKGHVAGAINMPLNLLKLKSRMLEENTPYLIYCNSGRRSEAATYLLGEEGFNVSALVGGYKSYSADKQRFFETL